jgi:hypothetical protein
MALGVRRRGRHRILSSHDLGNKNSAVSVFMEKIAILPYFAVRRQLTRARRVS